MKCSGGCPLRDFAIVCVLVLNYVPVCRGSAVRRAVSLDSTSAYHSVQLATGHDLAGHDKARLDPPPAQLNDEEKFIFYFHQVVPVPWPYFVICVTFVLIVTCSGIFYKVEPATKGMPDIELRKNENLDPDVYGFCITSLVRDLSELKTCGETKRLRVFRLALAVGLMAFTIFIQVFLLWQIWLLCTSKAVHDIRELYSQYELHMYGGTAENTRLTVNGKHRGLPEHFQPERFETFPDKEGVCNIPLSQPKFLFIVLFIWSLTCVGEVRTINELFYCLIVNTPTKDTMEGALEDEKGDPEEDDDGVRGEVCIGHLTLGVKAFILLCVILPRIFTVAYLLFLGCRWLTATNDFAEMVLNAVALEFVLLLKDSLYLTLVSSRNKRDVEKTEMRPPTKYEPASYFAFLGAFMWGIVAVGWVAAYMWKLQRVLPEYNWDVRGPCKAWIAENTHT